MGNKRGDVNIEFWRNFKELADALWISKSAVSFYEQETRYPSTEMLVKIADLFHVSTDYLLGRERNQRLPDITGLSDKDIEFLQGISLFLREKNEEREKTGEQDKAATTNCR